MKISLRAAPASIVLFKSNCTILFIINGSNMRRMMMEESQIFRIIPRGNMVDKKKARGNEKSERGVKKKINTTKRVKGASIHQGILVILIGTSANDFLFCAQKVSV